MSYVDIVKNLKKMKNPLKPTNEQIDLVKRNLDPINIGVGGNSFTDYWKLDEMLEYYKQHNSRIRLQPLVDYLSSNGRQFIMVRSFFGWDGADDLGFQSVYYELDLFYIENKKVYHMSWLAHDFYHGDYETVEEFSSPKVIC